MNRGSKRNRLIDRYLGIPALAFLRFFGQRKRAMPSQVRRIGVMCAPAIGDTLLLAATLRDLKAAFPSAEVWFFATPLNRSAAELLPAVDELVVVPMPAAWKAVRALRRSSLDILVDFSPWIRASALLARLSGARLSIGFRTAGQHRHWCYDRSVELSDRVHQIENYARLGEAIGVGARSQLTLRDDLESPVGAPETGRTVVFHAFAIGSLQALREWPAERWVSLARHLDRAGTTFILTGSPADAPRVEDLQDQLMAAGLQCRGLVGRFGLREIVPILKSASLVVSVNTGIMHLAAILGAPTVGINGPTADHRWGPRGPLAVSVAKKEGCGFLNLGFEFDGNPTDCMARISVDDVLSAIRTLQQIGDKQLAAYS